MSQNKSQRIVLALQQLVQFKLLPSPSVDFAFHVLSGVQINSATGTQGDDGLISIKFPGGMDFDIDGMQYLNLQIAESAAHEIHLDVANKNPIATRSGELLKDLSAAYNL
jgi:hypothetical protein